MHYEINVSLEGKHFFATHERSCTNEQKAEAVYKALRQRFLPESGYEIIVTFWDVHGTDLTKKFHKDYR